MKTRIWITLICVLVVSGVFAQGREVAKELNKDYRSLEVIKQYFLEDHNDFIDAGDGTYGKMPESFCDVVQLQQPIHCLCQLPLFRILS